MGGDLSPRRLLRAYSSGIFPWFDAEQPILWWAPNPRMVLLPGQFHASRSFKKRLRTIPFTLTVNQHFDAVIQACAAPREEEQGTWIIPAMQAAYGELHRLGVAHSIEVLLEGSWSAAYMALQLAGLSLGSPCSPAFLMHQKPPSRR